MRRSRSMLGSMHRSMCARSTRRSPTRRRRPPRNADDPDGEVRWHDPDHGGPDRRTREADADARRLLDRRARRRHLHRRPRLEDLPADGRRLRDGDPPRLRGSAESAAVRLHDQLAGRRADLAVRYEPCGLHDHVGRAEDQLADDVAVRAGRDDQQSVRDLRRLRRHRGRRDLHAMKRLLLLLAACGSSSPKMPDARVIDAPPDAPPVPHIAYVVNALTWPTTANEARTVGFDLDGNGTIDDQFGATLAALRSQGGLDVQTPTDTAIAHGVSITLADVQAPDLSAPSAGFTLYAGTNPKPAPCAGSTDTSCGHHLTGTGSFDVAAMPRDTPIVGPIASSVYAGGPGHLTLPVYAACGTPALITLLAAHVQFTLSANGLMQGRLGGAIAMTDLDAKLYPAMAQGYTATLARDSNMLQR